MHLHILAIEAALEAHTIRQAAEQWGADVTVTWVGNSQQVVDYFRAPTTATLLIICAHGVDGGLALPALAPDLQPLYPYHDVLTPEDFRSFLPTPLPVVMTTACGGGEPAMAEAFLERGAPAYVGATGDPDGGAALMFALEFVYSYLHNGHDVVAAQQQAAANTDDRQMYHVYQALPTTP